MQKVIVAIILALSSTAHAGGGATGGATEITQMMNNGELVAMVGESSQQTATQIQQYITQVSQLRTMNQNMLQMPLASISRALGPYSSQLMPYVIAHQRVTALGNAANNSQQVLTADLATMRSLNMQPGEFYRTQAAMSSRGVQFAQEDMARRQQVAQDLQARGEAVKQIQDEIPAIDSNIKGMQTLSILTSQAIGESQHTNSQLNELLDKSDRQALREESQRQTLATAAADYDAARRAERVGMQQSLAYPKK